MRPICAACLRSCDAPRPWRAFWRSRWAGLGAVEIPTAGCPCASTFDSCSARGAGFNLLAVTFDTVRTEGLGCHGDPRDRSPNLNALAQHGVRFARAISLC